MLADAHISSLGYLWLFLPAVQKQKGMKAKTREPKDQQIRGAGIRKNNIHWMSTAFRKIS